MPINIIAQHTCQPQFKSVQTYKSLITLILLVILLIESISCLTHQPTEYGWATGKNKTLAKERHRLGSISKNATNSNQTDPSVSYHSVKVVLPQFKSISDSKRQLDKHSYNLSAANTSQPSTNATTKAPAGANLSQDELGVSDAQIHSSFSSREDEEVSETYPDASTDEVLHQFEDYLGGASSNLNERKVIKEFTKLLSKSISGATEQVKLDTLENWKRRQKERKTSKDARAKLFEDILNAAISSHPDNGKGTKRKARRNTRGDAHRTSATTDLLRDNNVEPEMGVDAENVIQHIQGLASAVDSSSSFNPMTDLGIGEHSSVSPDEETQSDGADEAPSDANESEPKAPQKKPANERPLMRQFKKIKNQISQRRKQLDQIKKIFNVELSLNPKDGSLMGKSTSSGKKVKDTSGETDDSPDDNYPLRKSSGKHKGSKSVRMKELMEYLRANPDILVSVMSELTTDADSRSNSQVGGDDDAGSLQSSVDSEVPREYSPSQHRSSVFARNHNNLEDLGTWNRTSKRQARVDNYSYDPPKRFRSRFNFERPEYSQSQDNRRHQQPQSPLRPKSAEALLLESLRERQLLNLARLDMVLAERQQASNRSSTYATNNLPPTLSRRDSSNYKPVSEQMDNRSRENSTNSNYDGNHHNYHSQNSSPQSQSDGEVLHHFLMVNQSEHGNGSYSGNDQFSRVLGADKQPSDSSYHSQLQNLLPSSEFYSNGDHQAKQHGQLGYANNYQQQQPQANTLGRFRDWRDVSRTESGAQLSNDRTNYPSNVTWVPYDLSTGSSANAIDANKAASINNYRLAQAHARDVQTVRGSDEAINRRHLNRRDSQQLHTDMAGGSRQAVGNMGAPNQQPSENANKESGDLSITKPGTETAVSYANERPGENSRVVNKAAISRNFIGGDSSADYAPAATTKPVRARQTMDDNYRMLLDQYNNRPLSSTLGERFESTTRKDNSDMRSINDTKLPLAVDKEDFLNEVDNSQSMAPTDYFSSYKSSLGSRIGRRQHSINSDLETLTVPSSAPADSSLGHGKDLDEQTATEPSLDSGGDDMGAIWAA